MLPSFLFSQNEKNFYSVRDSISAKNISFNLNILADDSLEGRGSGSKGSLIAANFISEKFKEFSLASLQPDNTYFQNIPMHGSRPLSSSELWITSDGNATKLDIGKDYFLYRSGQQTFIPNPLPVVFVGYGIIAPEFDYNDYQSVDVEGKIVVYLDDEPYSEDEDYFNGPMPTIYSYSESKRRIAAARGAAGTIQISLNRYETWDEVSKDFNSEDVTLAYAVSSSLSLIINPESAKVLFAGSDYSYEQVLDMAEKHKIKSFPLKTSLKFKGAFKDRDFIERNVIGMVQGSDPLLKDSYIILSAHYDHLGIGVPIENDSIYNGALDNAIGVSVLLELARSFSDLKIKPKSSLIFIATTGEEKGLLGSSYYVDNPLVPLYKTVANINIDGIAMFKDFLGIVPVGSELSTLDKIINETANAYGLIIEDIPTQFRNFDAFNKSDQLAFALGGIPSILVLEGVSNKSKKSDDVLSSFIEYYLDFYHTPFDDLNQKIDCEAAARHAKIIFDFAYRIADQIDAPEWKSGSPFLNARLRSIAEKR